MAKITINGITMDPEREAPQFAALGMPSSDTTSTSYILIQTVAPLGKDQREALVNLQVKILEYVPENTYLARYEPADLGPVQNLPFVEWANPYLRDFKIAANLRGRERSSRQPAALLALGPMESSPSPQPAEVDVVLHNDTPAEDVVEALAEAAGVDRDSLEICRNRVRATIQHHRLERVAALDEVRHVEEVLPNVLFNNVARGILGADDVYQSTSLAGEGQTVTVCDTGFDRGSTSKVHEAFKDRVLKVYALGRKRGDDPHGHGTHVAGSVLGDGQSSSEGAIQGTAPKARLIMQSVLDSRGGLGGLPADLNGLFGTPYDDDQARIHTNSWGSTNSAGRYSQFSRDVDEFVWSHRDMVICFAAGNDGADRNANGVVDLGSVTAPGTAKNCITIGASESERPTSNSKRYGDPWPTSFPSNPVSSDFWATDREGMAAFSGRGPTVDGRIKPDVVAPGTAILSAHSRRARVGSFWGRSSDSDYAYMGGTSMATPLVAGCTAIVREYMANEHQHQPKAALVKAMLINGAGNIAGQYVPSETGATPNFNEGFGRVNLARTVGPGYGQLFAFFDEDRELDVGEEEARTVQVAAAGSTLKVTLVWSDPPGETLQNDLDLIVRSPDGEERHGNMPANSSNFDRTNNVEQVIWENAPAGDFEIVVSAHRITLFPQSYALVARTF